GAPITSANSEVIRVPQATRATPHTEGSSSGFHSKAVRKLTESALIAWIAWVIRNATIAPISTSRNQALPRAPPANRLSPRREWPVSPEPGPRRERRGSEGGPAGAYSASPSRSSLKCEGPESVTAGGSPLIVLLTVQCGRRCGRVGGGAVRSGVGCGAGRASAAAAACR